MYSLNEKIKNLKPYTPIEGEYDIRLDANESFLALPESIKKEVFDKINAIPLNRYPDALTKKACEAFSKFYDVKYENVVAGNGSDELISVIFNGFLMKNEKFAVLEKDFSMYEFYGKISECEKIVVKNNTDFSIDVDKLVDECIKNNVKMLIFSNPCNPTSLGLTKDKVMNIITKLPNTLVVVDEAYMDFWNESVLDEIESYSNLLVLKTCSKAFGLAGMRVGFAVGNKTLVDAIKAVKSPYNVNSMSQTIAQVILEYKNEYKNAFTTLSKAKNELYTEVKKLENDFDITVLDSKTNFVVIRYEKSKEVYEYLLNNKVSIRCFGDFLRVTAGNKEENEVVAKLIKEALTKLKKG